MSIQFFNEDVAFPKLKKRETVNWIKQVINLHEMKVGDISFIFCSDDYLLEVNRKYLKHDYYTDIITFDYVEENLVSGDIFISTERVTDNAKSFGIAFSDELNRIIVHGVLHLLGFKDKKSNDKKVMTDKENLCLKLLVKN